MHTSRTSVSPRITRYGQPAYNRVAESSVLKQYESTAISNCKVANFLSYIQNCSIMFTSRRCYTPLHIVPHAGSCTTKNLVSLPVVQDRWSSRTDPEPDHQTTQTHRLVTFWQSFNQARPMPYDDYAKVQATLRTTVWLEPQSSRQYNDSASFKSHFAGF